MTAVVVSVAPRIGDSSVLAPASATFATPPLSHIAGEPTATSAPRNTFGVRCAGLTGRFSRAPITRPTGPYAQPLSRPQQRASLQMLLCESHRHARAATMRRLRRTGADPFTAEMAAFQLRCTWEYLFSDIGDALASLGPDADAAPVVSLVGMLELFQRYSEPIPGPKAQRRPQQHHCTPHQQASSMLFAADEAQKRGGSIPEDVILVDVTAPTPPCRDASQLQTLLPNLYVGSTHSSGAELSPAQHSRTSSVGSGSASEANTPLKNLSLCNPPEEGNPVSSAADEVVEYLESAFDDANAVVASSSSSCEGTLIARDECEDEQDAAEQAMLHVPLEWNAVLRDDVRREVVEVRRNRKVRLLQRIAPGKFFVSTTAPSHQVVLK